MSDVAQLLKAHAATVEETVGTLLRDSENKTTEERAAVHAQVDDLRTELEQVKQAAEERERSFLPGLEVSHDGEGAGKAFSLHRAVKVLAGTGGEKECGYEREAFKAMEARMGDSYQRGSDDALNYVGKATQTGATDQLGAALIPNEVMADAIIPELQDAQITAQLGVTRFDGLSGLLTWPVDNGGLSVAYIDPPGESTIASSNVTFSTLRAMPHWYAARVDLTINMLTQPAVSMENFIRGKLVEDMALFKDQKIFLGQDGGEALEPQGLLATMTSAELVTAPTDVAGEDQDVTNFLRNCIKTVKQANADRAGGRFGFATSASVEYAILNTKDANGIPVVADKNTGELMNLMNRPLRTSEYLETGSAAAELFFYGDWSTIYDLNWGPLALAVSDDSKFTQAQRVVRIIGAHDVVVSRREAFAYTNVYDTTIAP